MFSRLVGRGPLLNSGRGFVATSARHGANDPASTDSNPDTGREGNTALPLPEININAEPPSRQPEGATSSHSTAEKIAPKASPKPAKSAATILVTFKRPQGGPDAADGDEVIKNVREISSYSWTDALRPTIVVPGFPVIWKEGQAPFAPQNIPSGKHLGMPRHHLLPTIAAAIRRHENYDFSFKKLDFVLDQRILFRLAVWAAGTSEKFNDFSFDVERVGKTVTLNCREDEPVGLLDNTGSCEKRAPWDLKPQARGLNRFYRVLAYSIGGMNLLVECEVEACLLDDGGQHKAAVNYWVSGHVDMTRKAGGSMLPGSLRVVPAGMIVKQSRTLHFNAVSEGVVDHAWAATFMQMKLGNIHHHVLGVHPSSTLRPASRASLDMLQKQHASANKSSNKKLLSLSAMLPRLCETIRMQPEGELMRLVCQTGKLTLETRTPDADPALPVQIRKLFK